MLARTIAYLFAALVAAVLLSSCGGNSDNSDASTSTDAVAEATTDGAETTDGEDGGEADGEETTAEGAPLTKAEFVEQGDAICEQGRKDAETEIQAQASAQEQSQAEGEKLIASIVLPAIQKQAEEIRGLGAPSGDEEEVEKLVKSIEDAVVKLQENPGLAFEGGPFTAVDKQLKAYGFKVCVQN